MKVCIGGKQDRKRRMSMKLFAINGSPRKNGNTVTLLDQALKGAQSQGVQTQRIDLYDLNYKGCVSCFYCKRKDRPHGDCAIEYRRVLFIA